MWQSFGVHAVEPFRPMPFSCPFLLLFLLLILLLLFYCLLARTILFLFGLARPVPWCALLGRVALCRRRAPHRERALQRSHTKRMDRAQYDKILLFFFSFFFLPIASALVDGSPRRNERATHTQKGAQEKQGIQADDEVGARSLVDFLDAHRRRRRRDGWRMCA